MNLREAAQQALEALHVVLKDDYRLPYEKIVAATDALNVALTEPVQEPVAWRTFDGEGGYDYRTYEDNEDYAAEWAKRNPRHVAWVEPLYTAPPQRKPLTDEELDALAIDEDGLPNSHIEFARAIEQAHGIKE